MAKKDEPKFSNWQEAWEYWASQTSQHYDDLTEDELIELIEAKSYDMYFTIWSAIGKKGTIEKSGMVLFNVLATEEDSSADLLRYHCADALFKILDIEHEQELREHCQWDLGDRKDSLKKLLKIIKKKLHSLKEPGSHKR